MTATDRDRRIWQIHDITSRIKPSDMTDAELEAAIAISRLAEARLSGNRPIVRTVPRSPTPSLSPRGRGSSPH